MRIERDDAPRLSVEALAERPVVAHVAAAVSYVSLAIMAGAVLPLMAPSMGRPLGVVTGLLLLVVGGLGHALVALRGRAETLEEQVGDLRREIAYVGDTLNVAARLLDAAKTGGRDGLVSADLLKSMPLPPDLRAVPLPVLAVRGRCAPLEIFALERSS